MSLSLAALLVAFILLALVRTLRSNLLGIHKNLIGALFFSQLVFVIGIAQTENPVRPRPGPALRPGPAPPPVAHVVHGGPPSSPAGAGRRPGAFSRGLGGVSAAVSVSIWREAGARAQHVGSLLAVWGGRCLRGPPGSWGSVCTSSSAPDPDTSEVVLTYSHL